MAKYPLFTEPVTKKGIVLPNTTGAAIDDIRRSWPGAVPSEAEVVRSLLQAALEARRRGESRTGRKTTP